MKKDESNEYGLANIAAPIAAELLSQFVDPDDFVIGSETTDEIARVSVELAAAILWNAEMHEST